MFIQVFQKIQIKNHRKFLNFSIQGVFDHIQHGENSVRTNTPLSPRCSRVGATFANDLRKMKEWIDQNPDYLLILLSDHGVDDYGPSVSFRIFLKFS